MKNLTLLRRLRSPLGKSLITYIVFLLISVVLWTVQLLSEEVQRNLRCDVEITDVPDSLTRVSPLPQPFNVSVRARGIDLVRYLWRHPVVRIEYSACHVGHQVRFGDATLKSLFREKFSEDAIIQSVTPDTLTILYTDYPGVELPVDVKAEVVFGPQCAPIGNIRALTDSVMVYGVNGVPSSYHRVSTEKIVLNNVTSSRTIRVALAVPHGLRAIPDSIDIHLDVEPLISKISRVRVTPVGVPHGYRLVMMPSEVEVYYMVPISTYKQQKKAPSFRVEADYSTIRPNDSRVAIQLTSAPKEFKNVYLATDSVEYLIEQR